jgi:hypothetical protein
VFISHAFEDQEGFVRKLAALLTALGLKVWYSGTALQVGDSLTASISRGLVNSSYGIVVISPDFIAKRWPNWELHGLVVRHNAEEQNVVLPVWHRVTKDEVCNFDPSLADLYALNTSVDEAEEIAFKLLHRIRPDIYNKYDRAQLKRLASGEAMRELQQQIEDARAELEATKEELAEYRCPFCNASLTGRNDAPLDSEQDHWDTVEHFACGYSTFAGETQHPCPSDPKFPRFEDFELKCRELKDDAHWKWACIALGKTPMARLLHLPQGLGRTQEEARDYIKSWYDQAAKRH